MSCRIRMVVDRVASVSSAAIAYTLFVAGSYFVAVLAAQLVLYHQEGRWFGSACSLHQRIDALSRCELSTSELRFAGGAVNYAMTQMDALSAIALLMGVLAGMHLAIGALRSRLVPARINAVAWAG